MMIKFRIHGDSSNPNNHLKGYVECICDITDINNIVHSGINGEFEYNNIWYDFCCGDYVTKPKSDSWYYKVANCLEERDLPEEVF